MKLMSDYTLKEEIKLFMSETSGEDWIRALLLAFITISVIEIFLFWVIPHLRWVW